MVDSIMNFIKEYATELDSLKRLIYASNDYYNGKDDTIKNTTDICRSISNFYKSEKLSSM